jgi:signal transduction histidine kinase
MNLRDKIGCLLPVTGLILLVLGFSGAWYVIELQKKNTNLLDVNVASIRAAEELEMIARDMRHDFDRYLLTNDQEHLLHAVRKQSEASQWLSKAEKLSATNQEIAFVAHLKHGLEEFFEQLHQLVDDPQSEISSAAVQTLEENILSEKVLVVAQNYLDFNEKELEQSNQQNHRLAEKLAIAMVLLGVCGGIAGLEAGYSVASVINRSMYQLSVPIRDVAGKLDAVVGPLEVKADPNLEDLQLVLETVADHVGSVVDQLHQRHQEVVRSDQLAAVGKLAAGLAHELRNPLMCMKTLVQSARHNHESASLNVTDIAVLDEEITRLDSLLQSFLDFARPFEPEFQAVEMTPIVRQTIDLVSSRAETRQLKIKVQLPSESVEVQGDAMQLRQVLLNLLLNAFDAVQNGGQIVVSVERFLRDGVPLSPSNPAPNWVCLSVSDNGCGLPAEQRERIYEPFFSTKEPGLGLGLAVCKRIIDAHQGELMAEERIGGGTVFKVMLPLSSAVSKKQ